MYSIPSQTFLTLKGDGCSTSRRGSREKKTRKRKSRPLANSTNTTISVASTVVTQIPTHHKSRRHREERHRRRACHFRSLPRPPIQCRTPSSDSFPLQTVLSKHPNPRDSLSLPFSLSIHQPPSSIFDSDNNGPANNLLPRLLLRRKRQPQHHAEHFISQPQQPRKSLTTPSSTTNVPTGTRGSGRI